ncbi:MAG: hypothetical protein WCX85_04380 [Bacilli bacterium]|jgi:hypothetical protein
MKHKLEKNGLLAVVLIPLLFLSSCGVNTKDWPHIELDFATSDISLATFSFQQNANDIIDYVEDYLVFSDETDFDKLISIIKAYPIKKERESAIETANFMQRIIVDFIFEDTFVKKTERIAFYGYGIAKGKVMLDNGDIHFVPGDIGAFYKHMNEDSVS